MWTMLCVIEVGYEANKRNWNHHFLLQSGCSTCSFGKGLPPAKTPIWRWPGCIRPLLGSATEQLSVEHNHDSAVVSSKVLPDANQRF